jgi:hypothetical protein
MWFFIGTKVKVRQFYNNNKYISPYGCEVIETSNQLFLECDFSQAIWCNIMHWLGVYGPLLNIVDTHALQFCNAYVFCKDVWSGLQAVWLAYCWTIWKEKSKRYFTHSVASVEALCDKVKIIALWLFKSSKKKC